jgi:membrane protein
MWVAVDGPRDTVTAIERRTGFMVGLLRRAAGDFVADECPMMAAALSYYTAFSLPPLLVLIVTVAGWIWEPQAVTQELEGQFSSILGASGWQQVETMMHEAGKQKQGTAAAVLGVLGLLLGATGVMVQLQSALNKAWEVQPDPQQGGLWNFITKRLLSLAMILAVAFLLLVSLVLTAVLGAAGAIITRWLPPDVARSVPLAINFLVSLIVFTLLFAAMFKWLPDAEVRWSDTWVGALATALLFLVGKFALGLYFSRTDLGTFGAAASFVLLLLWVYYSGMIFLFGAEFTQAWARSRGAHIAPSAGAVRVTEKTERGASSPTGSRPQTT